MKIYLNGKFVTCTKKDLDSFVPGAIKARGVFETMRYQAGHISFLHAHIDRLKRGAKHYGFSVPKDFNNPLKIINRLAKHNKCSNARIRISLFKDAGGLKKVVVCQKARSASLSKKGFSAIISRQRRNKSKTSHLKTYNYQMFREAYLEAKSQKCDEAILLNNQGYIVEGSRTNVFIVKGGVIYTPSVGSGCLNGVTRRAIINLAQDLRVPCQIKDFKIRTLKQADEVFLTNAFLGVVPLTRLEGNKIAKGCLGPVTKKMSLSYHKFKDK